MSDICVTGSGAPIISGITGCFFSLFSSAGEGITRNRWRYSHKSSFENDMFYFAV